MYATLAMGGQGQSHKNVSAERSWLMNKYYTNKVRLHANSPCNIVAYADRVTLHSLSSSSAAP